MTRHPNLSINIARNGHFFVTQGHYHPAFIILRDRVPQFLISAESCPIILIPPFASSALACYVCDVEIETITLASNLGLPGQPGVKFRLRARTVAYAPHDALVGMPRVLKREGIDVIVTPQSMACLNDMNGSPVVGVIARILAPETVQLAKAFASSSVSIRNAVEAAVLKTKYLIYEN